VEVGLYGKLPSHGDFLRRRASDAFVSSWDPWLQECIATSRSALADRWLDVYLTSPAWRFAAAAGACGPAPVIGVMVPSVDRVGRYFPLTVVAELPAQASVFALGATASFFERAERLMIDTLESEYVDFERFDEQVEQLADELIILNSAPRVEFDPGAVALLNGDGAGCWQLPIGSSRALGEALEQLLLLHLSGTFDPLMLWWTEGSSIVEPSCLVVSGLPHPERFAALMDGSWVQHRWRMVPAAIDLGPGTTQPTDDSLTNLTFRSAAGSDVGRVRTINQDAFLEQPEGGLWAVADGLGGHSDGEHASRMVCDALAGFVQYPSFSDTVAAVQTRMAEVNDHLLRASARSLLGDRCGTTLVALMVRDTRAAVLWAGDSRLYRWRSGRLEQLTRDHSPADRGGSHGRAQSNAVTRAVGVSEHLELDVFEDRIRPGDRFLLCSDGLTRTLPDARIQTWMESPDIETAVNGLIRDTLEAGAPDNVTALVVEASPATAFGLPEGNR
jgi:type VI secretion system ImpM family protein